jgi:histidinol-phosphate aminotransferase
VIIPPRPGVTDIDPYVGGKAHAHPHTPERLFKLSSNESPLGPSPKALAAYREAGVEIGAYPDGGVGRLREAIASHYGLAGERIVCGNGSDEILTLLANAYLRAGDEVIYSRHGFLVYRIATYANSATPVEIPEPELRFDVDAALANVTARTRLVYVANPNNPTGSYLSVAEMKRLHAGLPPSVLLIIDAAYAEYVNRNDYEAGIELVSTSNNVVMTRTFSKIYALAGLRVGWAYCPSHVADTLNRVRGPFNVNVAAQRAAEAALKDRAHIDMSAQHNAKWLPWLVENIRAAGWRADDSAANFVLIHFPNVKGKTAAEADDFLKRRGLILRRMEAYGLPDSLRLTVGDAEPNRLVVEALRDFAAR